MIAVCLLAPAFWLAQTDPAPAAFGSPTPAAVLLALPGNDTLPRGRSVLAVSAQTSSSSSGSPGDQIAETRVVCPPEAITEPAKSWSIFSRPLFADRHSLSWVLNSGPGRFEMIDWQSRPDGDHFWWLGRWPQDERVQLYWTIGFNIHWWAGPVPRGNEPALNLPPRVYDLYLGWTWAQNWSDRFATEVRIQPGLYTDFRTTPPDAFRGPGHVIGLYRVSPELYLVAGAQHLQRNDIHVLPVAGLLWQPTPAWELRLLFPEPKIAVQLSTSQCLWGYVAGEYGGGRWTYDNDLGKAERVEYSDYRVMAGIEWRADNLSKVLSQKSSAFLEFGYLFERRLRFAGPISGMDPRPAWMIRFGHTW